MAEQITDALVRRSSAGDRAQVFFWDTEVKGFGLRITNAGAKSFILDYRILGRQRRITIGNYPDWSVKAARREAGDLKKLVDKGEDPMGDRHALRSAPTVEDLWTRYQRDHLPRKAERSQVDERIMWEKLILPELGKYKVMEITHDQVESLHRKITVERGTPVRANRVVEVLRKAYNLAMRWEWVEGNPASGIQKNREEKRERFLSPEELARLSSALAEHGEPVSANAIRLLMLTGARKSEVLGATWAMFDLDKGVWVKPSAHTKQRREHRVPLSAVSPSWSQTACPCARTARSTSRSASPGSRTTWTPPAVTKAARPPPPTGQQRWPRPSASMRSSRSSAPSWRLSANRAS